MLRSKTKRISWAKFRSRELMALPLGAVALAAVFYISLAGLLRFPGEETGLTVSLLSISVLFLVSGICGLKRRYIVSIGFPFTPIITVGPLVVLQSWGSMGVWAVITLLMGYGYLSQ